MAEVFTALTGANNEEDSSTIEQNYLPARSMLLQTYKLYLCSQKTVENILISP